MSPPPPRRPSLAGRALMALTDRLMPLIRHRLLLDPPWVRSSYAMSPDVVRFAEDAPFMTASTCLARDFYHPAFHRYCAALGVPVHLHRKLWEWIFILHHAETSGVVRPGGRALVFGVGREPLPAWFVARGMTVTATDAPDDAPDAATWKDGQQRSDALAALPNGPVDRAAFEAAVDWRFADMRAIPPDLAGYDLVWSSCCFEHLGGIAAGLDFVERSVEQCLAPGGIAIHTTEFNLTSNEATLERPDVVYYRKRDLEGLIERMRARGHAAEPLIVGVDSLVMDSFVDMAPFARPHLRVGYDGHVVTSAGIVIRKKR